MKCFCIFAESLQFFKIEKSLPPAFSVFLLQSNGNDVQAPEHHPGAPAELLRLPDEGGARRAARKRPPPQCRPQLLLFLGLLLLMQTRGLCNLTPHLLHTHSAWRCFGSEQTPPPTCRVAFTMGTSFHAFSPANACSVDCHPLGIAVTCDCLCDLVTLSLPRDAP